MSEYLDSKTYVVAWLTFFDNEIIQQQVKALHEYHALEISDCPIFEPNEYHTITNFADMHDAAFDRDYVFSVIEIKPV